MCNVIYSIYISFSFCNSCNLCVFRKSNLFTAYYFTYLFIFSIFLFLSFFYFLFHFFSLLNAQISLSASSYKITAALFFEKKIILTNNMQALKKCISLKTKKKSIFVCLFKKNFFFQLSAGYSSASST